MSKKRLWTDTPESHHLARSCGQAARAIISSYRCTDSPGEFIGQYGLV